MLFSAIVEKIRKTLEKEKSDQTHVTSFNLLLMELVNDTCAKNGFNLVPMELVNHICPRNGFNLLLMELANDILGRLPRHYLCVARAVCKEWDIIVRSPDFLSEYIIGNDGCGEPMDGPTLALVDLRCDKHAFNVELKRWMHVRSFYEGPKVEVSCGMVACAKSLVVYNSTPLPKAYLSKTDDNFLWEFNIFRLQFVVRNPVLGTTKVLPPALKYFCSVYAVSKSTLVLEVLDGSAGVQGYKITVLYPSSEVERFMTLGPRIQDCCSLSFL